MNARTLDCQDCGDVVRHLTVLEAQMVALDPYGYIVVCRRCAAANRSSTASDSAVMRSETSDNLTGNDPSRVQP